MGEVKAVSRRTDPCTPVYDHRYETVSRPSFYDWASRLRHGNPQPHLSPPHRGKECGHRKIVLVEDTRNVNGQIVREHI